MIRNANKNDITRINELGSLFNKNFNNTYNLNKYLDDKKHIILLNEDEIINGLLIVYDNIDYLEIEGIVVDPLYRRQNIANNLLNYLINSYSNNKKDILLEVAINNDGAIKLYKKNNFEIINIRKKYYNGIDAYVMKRAV